MVQDEIRDRINSIKQKLTMLKDINEDIIDEIIQDTSDLLNFQSDETALLIFRKKKRPGRIKSIKNTNSPKIAKPIQKKPIDSNCIIIARGGSCFDNGNEF